MWEYASEAAPDAVGTIGRWSVRVRRSGPRGDVFTLVLADKRMGAAPVPDAVLAAAEIAVAAVLGSMRGADVRQVRANSQLLETLERGIPAARQHRYWARLADFGFVPGTGFLVLVEEPLEDAPRGEHALVDALDEAAAAGLPLLVANRIIAAASDAELHALLPDTAAARHWLGARGTRLAGGVSSPHGSLADVPQAVREAEHAHRIAVRRSRAARSRGAAPAHLVAYDGLRFGAWLAGRASDAETRTRIRRLMSPFDEHDDLLETLIVYLAESLSVIGTAGRLFLHPNTVRYRLRKTEELLDGALDDPFLLADLVLVLGPDVAAARAAHDERH
ncbi:CdaR family transcriptional regulator [Gulosibacter sp. 10]|uniref:PucR family transcriptional regulator n=1 Tax=Gulosibacter sp. 10 TaxID=1255570 RepID=UPI00097F140B|nr:helix-turn-helix domain-containing protein [Gulosibacter sp. 10]SJM53206.1 Putative regulatory protein [Gulosibacter sp. 10]